MSVDKPAGLSLVPLSLLAPGVVCDFFALLTEKKAAATRDGKPYFACQFKDRRRSVAAMIWADHPLSRAAEAWEPGSFYKIRGSYQPSERYGPQIEILQIRDVRDRDREEGFREADFFECSRFDPDDMFTQLRELVAGEIANPPLRTLCLKLLDDHAAVLKQLPAHERRFYPFPGGWLEHVLNVARNALELVDRYRRHYPEWPPPLNRDLVLAGAALHDIGRVRELEPPAIRGQPCTTTVPGRLFGHIALARDLIRDAARIVPDLDPDLLMLLDHLVLTHLALPEWGSPRLPQLPEVLILHHADDLDAKLEMYFRCLTSDSTTGPFTDRDPQLGKPLLKQRKE